MKPPIFLLLLASITFGQAQSIVFKGPVNDNPPKETPVSMTLYEYKGRLDSATWNSAWNMEAFPRYIYHYNE
ncbi:MAG TPA: hypothetical protein PKA00_07745 [Saprospiraceae bacterium]|nr:hypothetical protein [Saprospiraceae bacterium]HMQ82784.1 hypothetical protein [Saprospiraceae bacterium]